jgi:hypothetical protein
MLNLFKKLWNTDAPPPTLHSSLNWNNSVVAGSYALKQFTGDTHWECNDIDVMVACQTKQEFQNEADSFKDKSDMLLVREAWFDDSGKRGSTLDEMYHERVLGSKTFVIRDYFNYSKTVQLIWLKQNYPNESPVAILNETSDIPACVSYSVMNGSRIFHIPEKGREIIMTRTGAKHMICASRLEKYQARDYIFT